MTCDRHPVTNIEFEGSCPYCAALDQWQAMSESAQRIGLAFVKAALTGPVQLQGTGPTFSSAAKQIADELANLRKRLQDGAPKVQAVKSSLVV